MSDQFTVITQAHVHVKISSNATSFISERNIPKDQTVGDLKGKLELQTGCSCLNMKLELFNKDNQLVCSIGDDSAMIGSYPIEDDMRIHVTDPSRKMGEFEDVSKVEKFELSEEDYSKRTDSVRAFKQRMKLGRFAETDEETLRRQQQEKEEQEANEKALAASIKVNDRCEIRTANAPTRRATVMFVGEADFKPGLWVGVKYDEPVGKNDGSVMDRRYFECPPKYGGFVRPDAVTVGNFPEEGFSDDDLDEL